MKMLAALLLILSSAMAAVPAQAANQVTKAQLLELRQNCRADVQRLCPGVEPRDGQLRQCLADKQQLLSEACARSLEIIKASMPK